MESGKEMEEFRRAWRDTNAILMWTTVIVATLHTGLELLAMKHEIKLWWGREDMHGLSSSALIYSFGAQIVILLYILEE